MKRPISAFPGFCDFEFCFLKKKIFLEKKENLKEKKNEILICKRCKVLKEIGNSKKIAEKEGGTFTPRENCLFQAKIYRKKNEKCIENFKKINNLWEKQERIFSAKVKRNFEDQGLYEKSEIFRQKIEVDQISLE